MSRQRPVKEKVTTIGEGGKRFWLYPAAFHGDWVKRRRIVAYVLILIFFITPWTKVNGRQTILLDVAERKFAIFGMVFWPQDTLIFWAFLLGTVVSIFFITAQWGRLWCGWACPQTVFLEHVFRRIEIWIEGDGPKRRRLDNGPWTFEKIRKKTLKYLLFILVSSHFANTVLCYFAGTDHVLAMTFSDPTENWSWFVFMAFFNFMFLADFAWFREQFCIIACPYGRFQSVLLDKHSTIVGYDANRGEPRGVRRKGSDENLGDCIDCNRCVAVCPTGIDIRMGLQMECINCTACMDACDEIMVKTNKPKALIGYTSIADLEGVKRRFVRFRTMGYLAVIVVVWSLGGYLAINKRDLKLQLLRPPGVSFTLSEDQQQVTNLFQAKAVNPTDRERHIKVKAPEGYQLVAAFQEWTIPPGQTMVNQLFLSRDSNSFNTAGKERVTLSFYEGDALIYDTQVTMMGPMK